MKLVKFALAAILVVGCSSTATTDPALRRQVANVVIIQPGEKAPHEFTVIKEVLGVSCARQAGSSPSVDEAKEQMRVEAGKIGADAVVNVACEAGGVSWSKNCWKRVECRGDAAKWK